MMSQNISHKRSWSGTPKVQSSLQSDNASGMTCFFKPRCEWAWPVRPFFIWTHLCYIQVFTSGVNTTQMKQIPTRAFFFSHIFHCATVSKHAGDDFAVLAYCYWYALQRLVFQSRKRDFVWATASYVDSVFVITLAASRGRQKFHTAVLKIIIKMSLTTALITMDVWFFFSLHNLITCMICCRLKML